MSSDLTAALRRVRPERRLTPLRPRPLDALISLERYDRERPVLVLDTNVYILQASGRLSPMVEDFVDRALIYHCSVCLAEIATGLGAISTEHPSWMKLRDHYVGTFENIPEERVLTPDPRDWIDAGLIAGVLARTQGWQPHQRQAAQNDALIYLAAARAGRPVLTANRDDFDLIQQVAPGGAFIHF